MLKGLKSISLESQLIFALVSLALPPRLDVPLQYFAIITSLVLATIFFAQIAPDQSRFNAYMSLAFVNIVVLVLLGSCVLPATGKWAVGLRWQAILVILFGVTVVIGEFGRKRNLFWPYAGLFVCDVVLIGLIWAGK